MADLTMVIRNAQIIDGNGTPAYQGDIGIAGDKIVAIGEIREQGIEEIDAEGKAVTPGFIDIHTHYDPQLCWDRLATPSPEHGITSLIMGNCSISLAPVQPSQREKVIHMFGSVEDMEGGLLEATVPFSWQTFPEYLEYLSKDLGPNVGVFVGHSVLRFYVMGAESQRRAATDAEIEQMCAELRSALRAGAFGLSFSFAHLDEVGNQLPCFYADRREKLALLKVMSEEGRGMVECAPNLVQPELGLGHIDEFGQLALETGVTCTLSPILEAKSRPGMWRQLLDRFEYWQAKGAPIFAQTQTRPLDLTVKLSEGSTALSKMPAWRRILGLPIDQRMVKFSDPKVRKELESDLHILAASLSSFAVKRGICPANQRLEGQKVTDIALEQEKTFTDCILDIAIADQLETEFSQQGLAHTDEEVVSLLLNHPGVHIGSADAGAHITQFSGAGDTSYLLEKFVRERGDMTLERAVQRLTSELAKSWKIKQRGEITKGYFADLVIFDPEVISRQQEKWVEDVPGGSGRYIRGANGVSKVIVNGAVLVDNGEYSTARRGVII